MTRDGRPIKPMRAIAVLLLAVLGVHSAWADRLTVVTAAGARLPVIVDLPPGDGRLPAVVLAPGQGYHMALPAMEATARALAGQGIVVFRFNWSYFIAEPKGQPSDDLSQELRDLQAVLAAAKQHPRVAADNLSVGGKSLGSLVAWRALASDPRLRGALLLTPLCSRVPKGRTRPVAEAAENYPGFQTERRPTLWISGDRDPLCSPAVLYGMAQANPGADRQAVRVAIVGGDHSYENRELAPAAAEEARARNLSAVSALSASFVAEVASSPP